MSALLDLEEVMSVLKENLKFYNISSDLFDEISSEHDVQFHDDFKVITSLNWKQNRSLFLFIGIKSTKYIKKAIEKLNDKSVIMFHYFNVDNLMYILEEINFKDLDKANQLVFTYGDITDQNVKKTISQKLKKVAINLSHIQPCIQESLNIKYIRKSRELLSYVNKYRDKYYFTLGNDVNDTLIGIRNRMHNLKYIAKNPGLNDLKKKFPDIYKNKPAVIVSSGPSLDQNIQYLKEYQDQVLILSCDGSVTTLLKNGIVPDVVGSIERIYLTYKAFYEGRKFHDDIVLAAPPVVRPEIYNQFNNQSLIFYKGNDAYGMWMDEITKERKGNFYCGVSVSHLLLNLGHQLGCKPLILVGQDLSYSLDGKSHANESEVMKKVKINEIKHWVNGNNGEKRPTTYILKKFLEVFEQMILDHDMEVINSTAEGAFIQGAEVMAFPRALETFSSGKVPRLRSLMNKLQISKGEEIQTLSDAGDGIREGIDKFYELLVRCKKSTKDNEKALTYLKEGLKTQEELDFIYDTLEYVDNEIVKYIVNDLFLLMLFQYPIHQAINRINNIQGSEHTTDTLNFNLEVHKSLLGIIELFSKKTIKILIEGQKINGYEADLSKYELLDSDLLSNKKFDIVLD